MHYQAQLVLFTPILLNESAISRHVMLNVDPTVQTAGRAGQFGAAGHAGTPPHRPGGLRSLRPQSREVSRVSLVFHVSTQKCFSPLTVPCYLAQCCFPLRSGKCLTVADPTNTSLVSPCRKVSRSVSIPPILEGDPDPREEEYSGDKKQNRKR